MYSSRPSPIIPETIYGRLTLFCGIVEAAVIIILESIIAYFFGKSTNPTEGVVSPVRGIPVYLTVFSLAQVFSVILCWDALYHKNTIQIIGWVLFNFATFAYSIFQYNQMIGLFEFDPLNPNPEITDPDALKSIRPALVVIPIILGVFQLVDLVLAWKLYQEFGWRIYKKIGADPRMKNMYRWYQIFLMLLKFDFFFAVGFTIQFLALILQKNDPEFAITVAAIPIAAIITAMAVYGVRREDRRILAVFMLGLVTLLAYFIFKIWRTYNAQDPEREKRYQSTRKYLTFFGALSIFVVAMTLVVGTICWMNFGRGLQQILLSSGRPSTANAANGAPRAEQRKPIDV
ncbi:hypothetical protein M427DRAFT_55192 [Gonapodya prolifera JEL478]|uniref:DUF7789 domain-containing protein n=1 Tax=Gonapodya prolifera (strain JEL478) TaxID=1344416 RepID=A0A139AJ98_GONPJ|nr:hypothetical protein M427DRAFT_55192 [Gonapodya prolifera JEL478]|eukprot:KXS16862.1 hypothetical protein M427DRAFT_55192 [Gonapodya prolifera JEL478]